MRSIFVLVLSAFVVHANVYLHNPRGSNNRLDEQTREVFNDNRLFDSQNNNRGGYNQGTLYYYVGSKLNIEWTNQHTCGPNVHCDLILQFMCHEHVRDGIRTRKAPYSQSACRNRNCSTDPRYGMHENFEYYSNCRNRERNMGLFLGTQNLGSRKRTAQYTRQNPNGDRHGYECPEERDYYPYWQPTPWRDIAVLTTNLSNCDHYKSQSENVNGRFACHIPDAVLAQNAGMKIPITQAECEARCHGQSGVCGEWRQSSSHGMPAPDCLHTQGISRDNHLGDVMGSRPMSYTWTVPDVVSDHCVLRLRYNISSADYDPRTTTAQQNPQRGQYHANINIAQDMGLAEAEGLQRGYRFENNPKVKIFKDAGSKIQLQLAIYTAQHGRTFQDRSHRFGIKRRQGIAPDAQIYNVNVRGKRGNIVQVYPAVEYDFVPNNLQVNRGDYIHFQWTGSDRNPRANDGEGLRGSDRNNVVEMAVGTTSGDAGRDLVKNYPLMNGEGTFLGFNSTWIRRLAFPHPSGSVSMGDDDEPAVNNSAQTGGNVGPLLNQASATFRALPLQASRAGTYYYMCTRNNNFSNRSQKGRIVVVA